MKSLFLGFLLGLLGLFLLSAFLLGGGRSLSLLSAFSHFARERFRPKTVGI